MLTVMEASSFTPSVYSVHALTLLAEVKHSVVQLNSSCTTVVDQAISQWLCQLFPLFILITPQATLTHINQQWLGLLLSSTAQQYTNALQLSSQELIYNPRPTSTSV